MKKFSNSVYLKVEQAVGIIAIINPPLNALSCHVREGVVAALEGANSDINIHSIILYCEGQTFFAGADISEYGKEPQPEGPSLAQLIGALEKSTKPVIAAIHGSALGGGLEVAMGCHYRLATSSALLGFPEVHLGLIPAGGGTVRLPRFVGVSNALEMMISGIPISGKAAHKLGLVEKVVPGNIKKEAIKWAGEIVEHGAALISIRKKNEKLKIPLVTPELFINFKRSVGKKYKGFKAPRAIVEAVEAAVNLSFDEALEREQCLFQQCLESPESAAQRHFFASEQNAQNIPDVPQDTPCRDIKKVGVVGGGTMGAGISMCFANVGISVVLVEKSRGSLTKTMATIQKSYDSSAAKGNFSNEDVATCLSLIKGSLELENLGDADLIIEAIYEDLEMKVELFQQLDTICKPDAILASNTSFVDINDLASITSRPNNVIGTHFYSPAHVMKLLEVVRGSETSVEVIATIMKLAKYLDKVGVLVGASPGFVGNRMLSARSKESGSLLLQNALPHEIDEVLLDFGFPMGPYAMYDLAGLDVGWKKEKTLNKEISIRHQLCERGRFGQKTGKGFYDYPDGGRVPHNSEEVHLMVEDVAKKAGIVRLPVHRGNMCKRMIYAMINEAANILSEGIALRPSDIDVIWVYGFGWPIYRGGITYFADQVGIQNIVNDLNHFADEHGEQLRPAPLLLQMAESGKNFGDLHNV